MRGTRQPSRKNQDPPEEVPSVFRQCLVLVGWLGSPFDQRIFETDVRGLGVLCISNCPSNVPTVLSTNASVGTQTEDRSWNQTQGLGLQWPWRPFEFSADNSLASGGGRGARCKRLGWVEQVRQDCAPRYSVQLGGPDANARAQISQSVPSLKNPDARACPAVLDSFEALIHEEQP